MKIPWYTRVWLRCLSDEDLMYLEGAVMAHQIERHRDRLKRCNTLDDRKAEAVNRQWRRRFLDGIREEMKDGE